MAKKLDGMLTRLPAKRRARIERRAQELLTLKELRQAVERTQNSEEKLVIQDVVSCEQTQKSMALLKLLALGNRQIEEGKLVPAANVVRRPRQEKA